MPNKSENRWITEMISLSNLLPLEDELFGDYCRRVGGEPELVTEDTFSLAGQPCVLQRLRCTVSVGGIEMKHSVFYVEKGTDEIAEVRFYAHDLPDEELTEFNTGMSRGVIEGFVKSGGMGFPDAHGGYIKSTVYAGETDGMHAYITIDIGTSKSVSLCIG